MQNNLKAIVAATPAQPLTAEEQVTDDTLRQLARGESTWAQGVISDKFQDILARNVSNICGELLAYRCAARVDPPIAVEAPRNHAEEIEKARAEEQVIDNLRVTIARAMEQLDDHDAIAYCIAEIYKHGGSYIFPEPRNTWGSHAHCVSLLGVSAEDELAAAAFRKWAKCALRLHAALSDGQVA